MNNTYHYPITVSCDGPLDAPADIRIESYFSNDQYFYVKETDVMAIVTKIQQCKKSQAKFEQQGVIDLRTYLEKIKGRVFDRSLEIARTEALYQGTTLEFQMNWSIRPILQLIDHLLEQLGDCESVTPKGIVGALTPKFQSFYEIGWRVLYALVHRDGLIVKPATETALSALVWEEILISCELPAGLVSFIFGPGHRVGKFLLEYPGVRNISFSGAYESLKSYPISLEKKYQYFFNGKNSVCVMPDFDFKKQMKDIVRVFVEHNGRSAFSPSRLLILESMEKDFKVALQEYLEIIPQVESVEDSYGFLPLKPFEKENLEKVRSRFHAEEAKLIFGKENFYFYSDLANCSELNQENIELPIYNLTTVKYPYDMTKWINNNSFGHSLVIFGSPEKTKKIELKAEVGAVLYNPNPLEFKPIKPVKMSGFGDLDFNIPNRFFSYIK